MKTEKQIKKELGRNLTKGEIDLFNLFKNDKEYYFYKDVRGYLGCKKKSD